MRAYYPLYKAKLLNDEINETWILTPTYVLFRQFIYIVYHGTWDILIMCFLKGTTKAFPILPNQEKNNVLYLRLKQKTKFS